MAEPLKLDPETDPMAPRPFRVVTRRRETADVYTLELRPEGGDHSCAFQPGQFNMLHHFGVGEAAISVCGDPADERILVHTVRAVGGVTKGICAQKKGAWVGVRGPFGRGWPLAEAEGKDILVVAGGIGLAPLRPAVYQLLARRERFGRIALLYGARGPGEMLYRRELERWRGRFDLQVEATVDHAGGEWRGRVGVVTSLLPLVSFDPDQVVALICGPEIMMRFTVRRLLQQGVAAEDIFISMERNMNCGIGFCGHCQLGPTFVCKDGPVFPFSRLAPLFDLREV